jgi:hypothetical protein
LYTDASGFRFGGCVKLENGSTVLGDYWENDDCRPIHEKEADAVLKSLQSLSGVLQDSRVELLSDSMAVVGSCENQGGKSRPRNCIMKEKIGFTLQHNIDLHLTYVASALDLADAPSRALSSADTMLSEKSWSMVELYFGPHSVDLMSLDSNVMRSSDGKALKHFSPCHTPPSAGVNLFCQNVSGEENLYAYPPFALIFPVLNFLEEQGVACTIIVPKMIPLPIWWLKLESYSVGCICLGLKGEKGVVKIPSRKGFVLDSVGLKWPLFAFRVSFMQI